jgi:uncharacterized membrane protein
MGGRRGGDKAILAFNYVLMFLATFTFGLLSPLAVGIAYLRRGGSGPLERSHFDFQIKSFWHDVGLVIIGALAGFAAIAGGLGTILGLGGLQLPWGITWAQAGWVTIALAVAWAILWLYGFINLVFDSVRGLMRLATGRGMGKTRPL